MPKRDINNISHISRQTFIYFYFLLFCMDILEYLKENGIDPKGKPVYVKLDILSSSHDIRITDTAIYITLYEFSKEDLIPKLRDIEQLIYALYTYVKERHDRLPKVWFNIVNPKHNLAIVKVTLEEVFVDLNPTWIDTDIIHDMMLSMARLR